MAFIRTVLIEDHDLTRVGMRTALRLHPEITIVGEAANATEGFRILTSTKPDVAVVDIGLPDYDGIELTRQLRQYEATIEQGHHTRVVILTFNNSEEAVIAAFAAGADSYCMKDISMDRLVEALHTTFEGNSWLDPAIARIVLKYTKSLVNPMAAASLPTVAVSSPEPVAPNYDLTDRELEVLQLIVGGYNNAAIAERLTITVGTVKTHVRSILTKLSASDRTQAAVLALRSGLVD